jgi:ribosome biogenesis ATPase
LKSVANDSRLDGFSGADLHSLLRESSLIALKQRISGDIKSDVPIVVNSSHIEYALNKVKPSVSESERKHFMKMSSVLGVKH